jgi:hypothetical protein
MPNPSTKAWQDFSASTALLERESEKIHSCYVNKWIGVYKGNIEAVGETFDEVTALLASKHISPADSLVRFIGQKEMTLIL